MRSRENIPGQRRGSAESAAAAFFSYWFPQHNNVRYEQLVPLLAPFVRPYRVMLSRNRLIRGAEFRLWRRTDRELIYPLVLPRLARRHRLLLTVDLRQLPSWRRPDSAIVDLDDPVFSAEEVRLLQLPQVRALVVTTARAREIFRSAGVTKPIAVIPQPVAEPADRTVAARLRHRYARPGEVVVGYHAPSLTVAADGGARPRAGLDDVDLLVDAVRIARERGANLRLCLVGTPTAGVARLADRFDWLTLTGYVRAAEVMNHVGTFDVGAYLRTLVLPPGRMSIKIMQCFAAGLPVVANRAVDESAIVDAAGAGLVCGTLDEMADAFGRLARSRSLRQRYGAAGRRYVVENASAAVAVARYRQLLVMPQP
ncbi:glycosyltransferase [Micromonospora sp. NPDC003776]